MFDIVDGEEAGTVVIKGRLDASNSGAAQAFLDGRNGEITLDCAALEYISSAGLGALLKTHKRLLDEGGKLRLVNVDAQLQNIFQYSGFDRIFEIEPAG